MAVAAERLPVEILTQAAQRLAAGLELRPALELVAAAAAEATAADAAVVRVVDPADGMLVARAVAPPDSALAAELAGSRIAAGEITDTAPPPSTVLVAGRARVAGVRG